MRKSSVCLVRLASLIIWLLDPETQTYSNWAIQCESSGLFNTQYSQVNEKKRNLQWKDYAVLRGYVLPLTVVDFPEHCPVKKAWQVLYGRYQIPKLMNPQSYWAVLSSRRWCCWLSPTKNEYFLFFFSSFHSWSIIIYKNVHCTWKFLQEFSGRLIEACEKRLEE